MMFVFRLVIACILLWNISSSRSDENLQTGGDFVKVNEILHGLRISIPDSDTTEDLGDFFGEVKFFLRKIECYDIRIYDIATSYSQTDLKHILYRSKFSGIRISCDFKWKYRYKLITGQGDGTIETSNNSMETVIKMISKNFSEFPPTKSEIPTCVPFINIDDMDFKGRLQGKLLDTFEVFFRGLVEKILGDVLCDEVGKFTTKDLKKKLNETSTDLLQYFNDIPPSDTDPLHDERSVQSSTSANLLDLKNELPLNEIVHMGIEELDNYLGAYDESSKTLGINTLLREQILDENGALALTPSDIGLDESSIYHEDSFSVVESTVTEVRILGLDSVTKYDPVTIIGNQTLSTSTSVKYLDVEVDFTIDVKIHSDVQDLEKVKHVIEQPTAKMRIKEIDLDLAILLAVDEDMLGKIQVGSMLNLEGIPPCLLSTNIEIGISNIKFYTGTYIPVVVSNLVSIGIDREVSNTLEALNSMYRETILKILPNYFATRVKLEGDRIFKKYVNENASNGCYDFLSINSSNDKTVDFRDLLLQPSDAKALGGLGTSPYGDIPPIMKDNFNILINTPTKFGLTGLNEDVIVPLTNYQSNKPGTWVFSDFTRYDIDISKFAVSNLDTLGTPIKILEPMADPNILESFLHVGSGTKHLEISFNIVFSTLSKTISGINFEESEKESVEILLRLKDVTLSVQTLLRISEKLFFDFSVNQALDFNCWFAVIADSISIINASDKTLLALKEIIMELGEAELHVTCKSCNTEGTKQLPSIVSSLQEVGVMNELFLGFSDFFSEFLRESGLIPSIINSYISEAQEQCKLHQTSAASDRRTKQNEWKDPIWSILEENHQSGALTASNPETDSMTTVVPNKPMIPRFSRESVEFVILLLSVILHIVFVVRSLNYRADYDSASFDILGGELSLLEADSANFFPGMLEDGLVDISQLDELFGERINAALTKKVQYSGKRDMYINELVRNALLNKENTLVLVGKGSKYDDMETYSFDVGASLSLDSVKVKGFDSFHKINVFNAIGRHTVRNYLSLRDLVLEAKFLISTDSQEEEEMIARLGIQDINVDVSFLLALDKAKLDALELGHLLYTEHIFSCVLSTAHAIEVVHLDVDISDIHEFELTGFVSDSTKELLYNSSKAIVDLYEMDLSEVMGTFFQSLIIEEIEKQIRKASCPSGITAVDKYVDFRDLFLDSSIAEEYGGRGMQRYGDLPLSLMNLINDELVKPNNDGWPKINENLIRKFFSSSSTDVGSEKKVIDIGGRNSIVFSHFQVSNLDSVTYPLVLLQPRRGSGIILDNKIVIGGRGRPMKLQFRITMNIKELGFKIYNELDFAMEMHDSGMVASFLAMMDESTFLQFPVGGLRNIHCWVTTIPVPVVDKFGVVTKESNSTLKPEVVEILWGNISLSFKCIKCSSPDLENLNSLNEAFSNMTEYLSTDHMDESFDRLHSVSISRFLTAPFILDKIAQWQHEALLKCPSHNAGYTNGLSSFIQDVDEDITYSHFSKVKFKDLTYKTLLHICFVVSAALILTTLISSFIKVKNVIKQMRWKKSSPPHSLLTYYRKQVREENRWKNINRSTNSLMRSDVTIPLTVRLVIPLIIFGNIGLFLSGHLSLGATLNIQGLFAGQDLVLDEPFFEFSMMQSTVDMWNAGVKELAIVLFIFSGIWPYVKQTICLFIWFCPPCCLSAKTRGLILRWLDQFGKWSMVDIYIFYLSLVGFRMSIKSPAAATRFKDFYKIDILVEPLWGLYANLLAQLISQVSSHYMLYYHDKTVSYGDSLSQRDTEKYQSERMVTTSAHESEHCYSVQTGIEVDTNLETNEKKLSLNRYSFEIPCSTTGERVKVNKLVDVLIMIVGVGIIFLLFYGFFAASVELDFLGIVGIIMEAGIGEEAIVRHSQLTAIGLIMEQAKFINTASQYIGLTTLCLVLLFTSLISPVCVTLLLLYLWRWPMVAKKRKKVLWVIEILQAWQYMEVYIISVVLGSWQLGGISELLLNKDICRNIDGLFASLFHYGALGVDDAQCFYVRASICRAIYALIVAAFMLSWLSSFVLKAEEARKKQEKDKEDEAYYISNLADPHSLIVEDLDETELAKKKLHLSPVGFTESYRLFLVHDYENDESICMNVHEQIMPTSPAGRNTIDTDLMLYTDEDHEDDENDNESIDSSLPPSILKYDTSLENILKDLSSESDCNSATSNCSPSHLSHMDDSSSNSCFDEAEI